MVNKIEFDVAMIRAGFTNKSLAAVIGVSPTTLSYKRNNHREFTSSEIKKTCIALKLSDEKQRIIFFNNDVDFKSA